LHLPNKYKLSFNFHPAGASSASLPAFACAIAFHRIDGAAFVRPSSGMRDTPWIAVLAAFVLAAAAPAAEPLREFGNCSLVPTPWADGDSFLVRFPDGGQRTVRLYGADCIEWHVSDTTDERRLRAQRRYFGITQAARDPAANIALAKDFGRLAAEETARVLAQPFSVHTAFSDARGDGRYPRIYAFITTSAGSDLATHLVEQGLARAFGVYRATPDDRSAAEYRSSLADIELRAAKLGRGVWAKTNWQALPDERREQRDDDAVVELAIRKPGPAAGLKINPNTASRDDLMDLPGIGEAMANRIIESRPYAKKADLLKVPGIGPASLRKLMPHLDIPRDQSNQ
jgi:DNA uptake protein ComE-like DNA-binding protein